MKVSEFFQEEEGVSLLEIILAMLILGLVTGAIFTAFSFSRTVSWRSEVQIMAQNYSQKLQENLRLAVGLDLPSGLTLKPGYYVDSRMANPPLASDGRTAPTRLAVLNLPPDLQRFQVNGGDGVYLYIEDLSADYDGDGLRGVDFDGDGKADLLRVKLKIQWTSPTQ